MYWVLLSIYDCWQLKKGEKNTRSVAETSCPLCKDQGHVYSTPELCEAHNRNVKYVSR